MNGTPPPVPQTSLVAVVFLAALPPLFTLGVFLLIFVLAVEVRVVLRRLLVLLGLFPKLRHLLLLLDELLPLGDLLVQLLLLPLISQPLLQAVAPVVELRGEHRAVDGHVVGGLLARLLRALPVHDVHQVLHVHQPAAGGELRLVPQPAPDTGHFFGLLVREQQGAVPLDPALLKLPLEGHPGLGAALGPVPVPKTGVEHSRERLPAALPVHCPLPVTHSLDPHALVSGSV
mmetsp:Transcript_66006/g.148953  ORF Transcript_66006/g.148953 Transcript_66006/m.148953 type:complete len:231 (-) Transcript_66006:886-1578(-)